MLAERTTGNNLNNAKP